MIDLHMKLLRILWIAIIASLVGCGGGTTGSDTGGSPRYATISGTLLSQEGGTIDNAIVRAPASDAVSSSDGDGTFAIIAPIIGDTVTLEVETISGVKLIDIDGFQASSDEDASITLEVGESLRLISISISPRIPTPTPTPAQPFPPTSGTPAPTPTQQPIANSSELIVQVVGRSAVGPLTLTGELVETGQIQQLAVRQPTQFEYPAGLQNLSLNVTGFGQLRKRFSLSELPTYPVTVTITISASRSMSSSVNQYTVSLVSVSTARR